MANLPHYEIKEQLYESAHSTVYRATRTTDNTPVILKNLKKAPPSPEDTARFRREYAMTSAFDHEGIIKVQALESFENTLVMTVEDFGGESLSRLLPQKKLTPEEFLKLAIAIVDSLSIVHDRHIMHKDINPSNIIWNPETGVVKLIDFGISTELPREIQSVWNPNVLEGTLPYMSPEQTGRMNRSMDYRTDFYSLGATFYEMLTGKRPFEAEDAMGMVHCHIACVPATPVLGNGEWGMGNRPEMLIRAVSDIIMKLMSKNAEDRYQSTFGLKYDLQKCLDFLVGWVDQSETQQTPSPIPHSPFPLFSLGEKDISNHFQIPQKLYGREDALAVLLSAFERVSHGSKEIMLVAGYSGVGKSALVNEIHRPIVQQRGYFVSGKFDQFKRDIPYSAFTHAFQELFRQILSESEQQVQVWKDQIARALGPNGQLMIDIIPLLELLLGKQPEISELGVDETRNRFNLTFQNFMRALGRPEHPLVVFLDDLQWADAASLKLMELTLTKSEAQSILFIGAYRDNEVDRTHPLLQTLDEIQKTGASDALKKGSLVNTLALQPLQLNHVSQITADTLRRPLPEVRELAELCFQKTNGNPFFLSQFLQTLYEEIIIELNREQGCWEWEMDKVRAHQISDDVVELMVNKLKKLSETSQRILKLAACVGNTFNLKTLSLVYEKSSEDTSTDLWESLKEGLIEPADDMYKFVGLGHPETSAPNSMRVGVLFNPTYNFVHDRIQQAAYSLIEESHKQESHLAVGRIMLNNALSSQTSSRDSVIAEVLTENEDQVFDIVNHFNQALSLLNEASEKELVTRLNLQAGRKALKSNAYKPALEYFEMGLSLLTENDWDRRYELTMALHTHTVEAAYFNFDFERMEQKSEIALGKAKTVLEQVPLYDVKMKMLHSQHQLMAVIQTGFEILNKLGVHLPENPNKGYILLEYMKTRWALRGKTIEDLYHLPLATDAHSLGISKIMGGMMSSAYFALPDLLPIISLHLVRFSLQFGNFCNTSVYPAFGLIQLAILNDPESCYEFGELGLRLSQKEEFQESRIQNVELFYTFNHHWKKHLEQSIEPLWEGYQTGMESGDIEYALYCLQMYLYHTFHSKNDLKQYLFHENHINKILMNYKEITVLNTIKIQQNAVLNLTDIKIDFKNIKLSEDDPQLLESFRDRNDQTAIVSVFLWKQYFCYLYQDYSQGLIASDQINLDVCIGVLGSFHYYIHDSLIRLALVSTVSRLKRQKFLLKVKRNQKQVKHYAHHAPENFLHQWHLVEAELFRVQRNQTKAIHHFNEAIIGSKKNNYLKEEALSYELFAKFWIEQNNSELAEHFMHKAHYAYSCWGALAKVRHLEETYPAFFGRLGRTDVKPNKEEGSDRWVSPLQLAEGSTKPTDFNTTQSSTRSTTHSTGTTTSNLLDLTSIMKASQAISGEIVLETLLKRMIHIVLENAGAQKATLFVGNGQDVQVLQSISFDGSTWLHSSENNASPDSPPTVINYVKRTRESVLINDLREVHPFSNDPYLIEHKPKSILCLPILRQTQLICVLYLENNLTTGAFTPDRLEVLRLLSSQAAISLENALLYSNLEQRVEERTLELSKALEHLKTTQSQLVESEKMASLGGLVAGVAHEINTPLGVGVTAASNLNAEVGNFMEMVQKGSLKKSQLEDFFQVVQESSDILLTNLQRAAELVQSFKKVAVDRTSDNRQTFKIREYLEEVLRSLHPQLKKTKHHVEIECDEEITLESYPGEFSQIVTNLVMNSLIHAFDEGDEGTLRFEITQNPKQLQLIYRDNGKGIPPEHLPKIFDPFFTTKRAKGGTGLGLHIVYNIVTQKLGGTIRCESEVGKGTVFIIQLTS
ncbi:ATP-binding sensor histidine kinase [Deltaproteobacteria bacterium TL4]